MHTVNQVSLIPSITQLQVEAKRLINAAHDSGNRIKTGSVRDELARKHGFADWSRFQKAALDQVADMCGFPSWDHLYVFAQSGASGLSNKPVVAIFVTNGEHKAVVLNGSIVASLDKLGNELVVYGLAVRLSDALHVDLNTLDHLQSDQAPSTI